MLLVPLILAYYVQRIIMLTLQRKRMGAMQCQVLQFQILPQFLDILILEIRDLKILVCYP